MRRLILLLLAFPLACGEEEDLPLPDAGFFDAGVVDAGPTDAGGIVAGKVVLSADRLEFGRVVIGSTQELALFLTNPGTKPISIQLQPPSGQNAAEFSSTVNVPEDGGRFTLEAGGLARITVRVTPADAIDLSANLVIDSCDGTCPTDITLTATGVRSGLSCPPGLDLGQVNLGECSRRSVTCVNQANVPERLTVVELDPTSDPAYALDEPSLPIELAPTSSATFELRFCPTVGGPAAGELVLVSFLPFDAELRVPLMARGGGADLRCTPDPLDFRDVGVGAMVTAAVVCENQGTDAALITATLGGTPEFSLVSGASSEIAAGESGRFEINFAPTSPGLKQDNLQIVSNDPDSPTLQIPIQGNAIDVGPCTAAMVPTAADFGLVAIGDARILPIHVRNLGSDPCLVRDLSLGSASSPAFSVSTPLPVGTAIAPNETRRFFVRYAPTTNAVASGTVELSFSNPGTGQLSLELDAIGGGAPLIPAPSSLDFGRVPTTCAEPMRRRVALRWVAASASTVNAVQLVSIDGSFTLSNPPNLPVSLALGDRLEVEVAFAPAGDGPHEGALRILTSAAPSPILVPLYGEGGGPAARAEVFPVPAPKVDVLFVVDDSATMGPAQAALSQAMPVFTAAMTQRGADVHLAFVTTDMEDPSRSGAFYGSPLILTSATPGLGEQLIGRSLPGISGSGTEIAVAAAVAALTPPLSTGVNQGFVRPGADLVVVIVSEEDEQSPSTPTLAQLLVTLRQASGSGELRLAGIVGPANGECTGPYGPAANSPRYAQLLALAGAPPGLYCQPMAEALEVVADVAFGGTRFPLSGPPVVGSLGVKVNGTSVPARNGNQPVWDYELIGNQVVFLDRSAVPAGATVEVDYDLYCVSATCGNGTVEAPEQCDVQGDDSCYQCFDNACGDGRVAGTEACDDGNLVPSDACIACAAAACGDGHLQLGVESCDDGNSQSGDGCPSTCRFYSASGLVSQAFVPLVGGTDLDFGTEVDDGVVSLPMPFPFRFFDVPTASVSISVNGFLAFAPIDVASSYDNDAIPSANLPDAMVAPWWDDLYLDAAVAGGANIRYTVTGTTPSRVMVVEWRDLRVVDHNTNNHRRFTFQAVLHEGGLIELRYGSSETSGAPPTAASASAGIEDEVGGRGYEALGCSPNCDGRPRPPRADGFPIDAVVTFTP